MMPLIILQVPHGNLTGPGLSSISPEMVNKRNTTTKCVAEHLIPKSDGAKIAGSILELETILPPLF